MRQFLLELSKIWFFEVCFTDCYSSYGKTKFWLAPHSHQSRHLMHQIFSKAKMRSRFIILCQSSLNDLSFILFPSLLYKPSISFIPRHTKTPSLLISWVLGSWLSETHSSSPNSSFPSPLDLPQEFPPPLYGSCMKV